MNTLLFIVDNPQSAGLGHVMRCSELVKAALEQGFQCLWVSDGQDIQRTLVARDPKLGIEYLSKGLVESEEHLHYCLKKHAPSAVIIDSYQLCESAVNRLCEEANALGIKTMGMDDGHFKKLYCFDFLMNAASTQCVESPIDEQTILLVGPPYTVVRSEIVEAAHRAKCSKTVSQMRKKLLITFGASDVLAMTMPLTEALFMRLQSHHSEQYQMLQLQVVIGPQVTNSDAITKFCAENHIECWMAPSHYPELVANADFAITAAGGSLFEFAHCGVPSVVVTVAANQIGAAHLHSTASWCEWVDATEGSHNVENVVSDVINALFKLVQSPETYMKRSNIARSMIDGKGATRVIQELTAHATH